MPRLVTFDGVTIFLFFVDTPGHHTPHVHAKYAEFETVFAIEGGVKITGSMPSKKERRAAVWVRRNASTLTQMWEHAAKGEAFMHLKDRLL